MVHFSLFAGIRERVPAPNETQGQDMQETNIANILRSMEKPSLKSRFFNRMKRILPVQK
tara:strand:+ start:170 stop:346 length:177 start_codon:yes stop_codon:yes gene_type:complete